MDTIQHRSYTPGRVTALIGGIALMVMLAVMWTGASVARAEDKAPTQTPREASKTMKELLKDRVANVGKTARGQDWTQAPKFKVVPRKPALTKYPCTGCHDNSFVDRRVRKLVEEHPTLQFDHGNGRLWCYDACHNGRDMDHLVTLRRQQVDYDESYKVCGQCHFERQKDWAFGGHGRRAGAWGDPAKVPEKHEELKVEDRTKIAHWKGERELLSCTACHNPHSPAIRPFTPSPAPQVRAGLTRTLDAPQEEERPWMRKDFKQRGEAR